MIDWNTQSSLLALTHLDGRNSHKISSLRPFFSEYAWIKARLGVMCAYLVRMYRFGPDRPGMPEEDEKKILAIAETFGLKEAESVQKFEKTVNHDVKAIELYLASELEARSLSVYSVSINLGIGSEDINSIALSSLLQKSRDEVFIPILREVIGSLCSLADREKNTRFAARTHAQPANITTFGKEIANTVLRLCDEFPIFSSLALSAKCSGEVGSLQGHFTVSAHFDWLTFLDDFVKSFGLIPAHGATQIAPYERIVSYLQSVFRLNTILLDLSKNMWLFVLLGFLTVKKKDEEVGSAGMPHKVNPIYYEGAEGGFVMANGIIEIFCRALPINRLSRDFSDSTIRRNLVLPLAYSLLSYQSILEGLSRTAVDRDAMKRDMEAHEEIFIETIKAFGLTHGIAGMFDILKTKTRGRILSRLDVLELIRELPLSERQKSELTDLLSTSNPYPSSLVDEACRLGKKVISI
ncbi:MAG: lyase family protein [bacterium]|nr:lyase family protein [bacterium]